MIFCKKTRPKNISSICNIRILKYDKNEPPCPNWRGKGAQKSPKVWPFALGKLCLVSDEATIYIFLRSGKEVETVVNEPCLEIVYENFVLILLSGDKLAGVVMWQYITP